MITNKFESSNIKFHKSLSAETGKLEGSDRLGYVDVQDRALNFLKLYPACDPSIG